MNRDAWLATLIGFGIGLVITGLLLLAPDALKSLPKLSITLPKIAFPKSLPSTTPTPPSSPYKLTIESPLSDSIANKAELLVSGTALPESTVVIAGPEDETVIVTKEDGQYAGKITLSEGKNEIEVTGHSRQGQQSQTVTVFYTPEEF